MSDPGSDDPIPPPSPWEETTPFAGDSPGHGQLAGHGQPAGAELPRIPRYLVIRRIGAGGMGEVFEAEQQVPVRRTVALKLVKPGFASSSVLARFDSERQVLALMNHSNIARVYDAGATEDGRPWFAMELVAGEPITTFCDRRGLTFPERLDLFQQACEGVQHAHRNGIIHRDLKPTNLLVCEQDGRRVTKVIDFGIAKAVEGSLTGDATQTVFGETVGTPAYMSPEQSASAGSRVPGAPAGGIDTRTDVYSLGVVLYELLVGVLPLDPDVLPAARSRAIAGAGSLARALSQTDPGAPHPSTRFSKLGGKRTEIATCRGTDAATLRRQLNGDLSWIVMKAIDPDRERRYDSASALSEDVRRHLANEPVVAGPPTLRYRAGKFVRRHRFAVASVSAITLAIIAGAVLAVIGFAQARAAQEVATQERDRARAINVFLLDMLKSADPFEGSGRDTTVLQALDSASKKIDAAFEGQPATKASVLATLGGTFSQLGRSDEAQRLIQSAIDILRQTPGSEADLAQALNDLAVVADRNSRFDEVKAACDEALSLRRRLHDGDDPGTAEVLSNCGSFRADRGDFARAEPMLMESLAMRRRLFGDGSDLVATTLGHVANLLAKKGDLEGAEKAAREEVEMRRRLEPAGGARLAGDLTQLGTVLQQRGDTAGAEAAHREALSMRLKTLGADHPDVAQSQINLASVMKSRGDLPAAESLIRQVIDTLSTGELENSSRMAFALQTLASTLADEKKFDDAEAAYRRSLAIFRETDGAETSNAAMAMNNLANLLMKKKEIPQAEALFRETLALRRKILPAGHSSITATKDALAVLLAMQTRYDEALPIFEETVAEYRKSVGPEHPRLALSLSSYGNCLFMMKRYHEALAPFQEAHRIREAGVAKDPSPAAKNALRMTAHQLQRLHEALGNKDDAENYRKIAEPEPAPK